jgi:hypothetical protein
MGIAVEGEMPGDDGVAMSPRRLNLVPVAGTYAVCRLDAGAPVPTWAVGGRFTSVTRTADEVSVVCEQAAVPTGVRCERGWRCLRVAGTLDFSMTGVLASLAGPPAAAGVAVFVISTFDTDYLFLKEQDYARGVEVLRQAGHEVNT